jgi:hypothetical protein
MVSFPDHPWATGRVILFSLPWDERAPVKAFLDRLKRRMIDLLHARSIAKAMEAQREHARDGTV